MKTFFLLLFFSSISFVTFAQTLTSAVPNSAAQGQTVDVTLGGSGTNFVNGVSVADFGSSVTVAKFSVINKGLGIATISIKNNAPAGFVTITVTTGKEQATLQNGFEIFQSGSAVRGVVELTPVQTIYLSDFDPTNIQNNPVIFYATLYNDAVSKSSLILNMYLYAASKGNVAKMSKTITNVNPNSVLKFSNRDFPKFEIVGYPGQELFYKARETGILPPDQYTYKFEITDASGNVLATDEVTTILTNPVYNPELISPGNNFNRSAEEVYISYPLFQWFGQADKFDFALYIVMNGQSPEEAVRNIAVFKQSDLTGNNMLYPAYAEKLIDGKTYAWQIYSKVMGSNGAKQFPSEVFWFRYKSPQTSPIQTQDKQQLVKLSIQPQTISLNTGESYQFSAIGFDANSNIIQLKNLQWRLAPIQGNINENGLFTAGSKPISLAVIVKSGELEDFATVTIKAAPMNIEEWMVEDMLIQLFGLKK